MEPKIRIYGDPVLRKKCEPVVEITPEIKKLIETMVTMVQSKSNRIGLSAIQIGVLYRIFVILIPKENEHGDYDFTDPKVYINPKITIQGDEYITMTEACLSLPHLQGEVTRPYRISIEALDENGTLFTQELSDFYARMIMHENDHLNGVLFIDRMAKRHRKALEPMLRKLKEKYS